MSVNVVCSEIFSIDKPLSSVVEYNVNMMFTFNQVFASNDENKSFMCIRMTFKLNIHRYEGFYKCCACAERMQ